MMKLSGCVSGLSGDLKQGDDVNNIGAQMTDIQPQQENPTEHLFQRQMDAEKDTEEMAEIYPYREMPVWFHGKERWVTGLSKHTTCDDVIYAMTNHVTSCREPHTASRDYVMFEGWKGVERPLRGRTKIMKVWKAWGGERTDVQFTIRRVPASKAPRVCDGHRVRKSHKNRYCERCRRHSLVSSASSDDTSSNRGRHGKSNSKMLYKMANVIIDQEKKLKEVSKKVKAKDLEVKVFEEKHPKVPEVAYSGVQSSDVSLFPAVKSSDLDTYVHILDNVLHIESMITEAQDNAISLSEDISKETKPGTSLPAKDVASKITEIRDQIKRCHAVSSRQQRHLEWMTKAMGDYDRLLGEKYKRVNLLERQLRRLDGLNTQAHGSKYSKSPQSAMNCRAIGGTHGALPSIPETPNAETITKDVNKAGEIPVVSANNSVPGVNNLQMRKCNTTTEMITPLWCADKSSTNVNSIKDSVNNVFGSDRNCGGQQQEVFRTPFAVNNQYPCGFLKPPLSDTDSTSDTGISSLHSGEEGRPLLDTLV